MNEVLVLSKSFAAPGGVANFVRSVLESLPPDVRAHHLAIGRDPERKRTFRSLATPLLDNVRLARRVRAMRPSCVHVNPSLNWPSLLRDGAFLLTLRVIRCDRIVVFFHGWSWGTAERIERSPLLAWTVARILRPVPVICVLSSTFKASLERMGVAGERIHVLTTMYDGHIFHGLPCVRRSRSPTILFLGRLVPEKGAGVLLEAFAELAQLLPEARLVIAGDGPEKPVLEARAAVLGLQERVSFPGYLTGTAKGRALLDADVFAFPTRYGEGCPVALLEAMAAGLPIVTTRAGGIPDIFEDGINGLLIHPVRVDTIKAALRRALTDQAWARECGYQNRAKARQTYTGSVVGSRLRELYRLAGERP